MIDNPYSLPLSSDETGSESSPGAVHRIVTGWERYRLIYNVVLGVPGILLLLAAMVFLPATNTINHTTDLLFAAIAYGIVVNICFSSGPLCEIYVAFFRQRDEVPAIRLPLVILGTVVSLLPYWFAVFAILFDLPDQL